MECKSVLDDKQLSYISDVMKKWCPDMGAQFQSLFSNYFITHTEKSSTRTQLFLKRICNYVPWMISTPNLLYETLCYYLANVVIAFSHYETLHKLHGGKVFVICEDRILKFSLVCVIADFVLDSSTPETRPHIIKQMKTLISSLSNNITVSSIILSKCNRSEGDSRITDAFRLLGELVKDVPDSVPCIIKTFQAELCSIKQQNGSKLDYNTLLKMESDKAFMSCELMGLILNNVI